MPLTGLRNQKGKQDTVCEYDDGSVGKDKFVFNYDLTLEDCDKKSTKNKKQRED